MPERDAVREHADLEYLAKLLELHNGTHTHIGITQPVAHAAARSIRALLSRAQPEGEAVAWAVVGRDAGLMRVEGDKAAADAWCVQLAPGWADGDSWRVVPILYPAPSGGEAHTDCAELDDVVREVFCRVFGDDGDAGLSEIEKWHEWYKPSDWLWWGRGLGTFLEKRIKERAGAMAAPRPEPGEVTDEQLCDLYRAHWQTRVDNAELIKAEAMLFAFVRAALAAREPKP